MYVACRMSYPAGNNHPGHAGHPPTSFVFHLSASAPAPFPGWKRQQTSCKHQIRIGDHVKNDDSYDDDDHDDIYDLIE